MLTEAGACDAHMHIIDAKLDPTVTGLPDATVPMYRALQASMRTQRTVIVQPRHYGTDNGLLLRSIADLGLAHTRGVAVVHPSVSDATLAALHAGGVRGLRFTLYTAKNAVTHIDMLAPLAQRIAPLGWHVQLHFSADQIAQYADILDSLPCPIVFDHCARLPTHQPEAHPAFTVIRRLIMRQQAWVKLSGAYFCSAMKADTATALPTAQQYADVQPIVRALLDLAPQRLVWGSDWPHVTEPAPKPDALLQLRLFKNWVNNDTLMHRILVDNAADLYGF